MVGRFVSRLFALAAFVAMASSAAAQAAASTGSIAGRITEADGGKGASGVRVQAVSGLKVAAVVLSSEDGRYRIGGLATGTYAVVAMRIGYAAKRSDGVVVRAGATTTLDLVVTQAAASLNEVVTTASRGAAEEKVLDAPASISVVSSEQMNNRPSSTIAAQMKSVPGVAVSQGGLVQTNMVSRGFNNAFSTSMLMLQDYRNTNVPSLRANIPFLFTGTNEDVERIEVLNGPAAALYGPNSANGVMHIITKSPFNSQGTTLTVDGGTQSLIRGAFRTAGTFADNTWGYKLSGEYFKGVDFSYRDPNEPATYPTNVSYVNPANGTSTPYPRAGQTQSRDENVNRYSTEARLDYRPNADFTNILTAGYTKVGSAIELTTAFGASQVKNWSYSSLQDRIQYKKFFAQVFYNANGSGNSSPTDPSGTFYLRTGIPVVDNSSVLTAQVQQAFDALGAKWVTGADYISTHPRSAGSIFGLNEGNTDILEYGAYLQATMPLTKKLDLVWAGRGDQTDRLAGTQFSPRVAFMYKLNETNNLRFTFGRAFNSPASFSYFLDQLATANVAPGFNAWAVGNPPKQGWQFNRGCDATINNGLCMHTPWGVPTAAVPSSAANAYPGFMAALPTVIAGLPAGAFASAADPTGVASKAQLAALVGSLGPFLGTLRPTNAQVGTVLAIGSAVVPASSVVDLSPLQASFNNTWEIGYKSIIADKLRIAVDLWYQVRGDVGVPIGQINPLVMYDATKLIPYLTANISGALQAQGMPKAQADPTAAAYAAGLGGFMAKLPQGTIALTNTKLAPDQSIIATYQNATGTIDVRGADIAIDYQATDRWLWSTTLSHIGQIVFPSIGGAVNPLMSNSPKWRASGGVHYSNESSGWSWDGTVRYTDAFPVNSGLLNSLGIPPNPTGSTLYPPVPASTQFDLGATWKPQPKISWSLNVTNLLDVQAPTFVGTPNIGRMVVTRIRYEF
jgi:iron complex outermembrane receptor protein